MGLEKEFRKRKCSKKGKRTVFVYFCFSNGSKFDWSGKIKEKYKNEGELIVIILRIWVRKER